MENKTISQLNDKMWYRLLKVIFIAVFLVVLIVGNLIFISASWNYNSLDLSYEAYQKAKSGITETNFNFLIFIKIFFLGNFIILLFFEVIKRSFYYVVFGTLKPKK